MTVRVWRLFSSVRLAVIVIITISGLSLLGAFLPDIDVFHSWWFLTVGAVLVLNIIVCSLNRWGNIAASIKGGPVRQQPGFYAGGGALSGATHAHAGPSAAAGTWESALRRKGYRVRVEKDRSTSYLAADKNCYFRLFTYVSHLSLVLIVIGYLVGGYLGFRDSSFTVTEGEVRAIGHGTGLSLKLVSFADEYYSDGTARDYRSDVVLYKNAQQVDEGVVRVNHPLTYGGVRIYQSYFGPAVRVSVADNATILYQGGIPLNRPILGGSVQGSGGTVDLPAGLTILVFMPNPSVPDSTVPAGELGVIVLKDEQPVGQDTAQKGVPLSMGGVQFTYESDARFSGFQISHDPANAVIWIGSSLFILGVLLVFCFPYRQVWALFQSQPSGDSHVLVRLSMPRGYNGAGELRALIGSFERELPAGEQEKTGG